MSCAGWRTGIGLGCSAFCEASKCGLQFPLACCNSTVLLWAPIYFWGQLSTALLDLGTYSRSFGSHHDDVLCRSVQKRNSYCKCSLLAGLHQKHAWQMLGYAGVPAFIWDLPRCVCLDLYWMARSQNHNLSLQSQQKICTVLSAVIGPSGLLGEPEHALFGRLISSLLLEGELRIVLGKSAVGSSTDGRKGILLSLRRCRCLCGTGIALLVVWGQFPSVQVRGASLSSSALHVNGLCYSKTVQCRTTVPISKPTRKV